MNHWFRPRLTLLPHHIEPAVEVVPFKIEHKVGLYENLSVTSVPDPSMSLRVPL